MSRQSSQPSYRIFRLSGNPIFAVPTMPRGLNLKGIERYQPVTLKRATFRLIMRYCMILGIDRFLAPLTHSPVDRYPGFEFQDWLEYVREILDHSHLNGVLIWPPQRNRGRVYVHLFNREQVPVAFAKICFDEHNHRSLEREYEALQDLGEFGPRAFHVPKILARGNFVDSQFLITEPIPTTARPMHKSEQDFPGRVVQEFAGDVRLISRQETSNLSWWQDCMNSLKNVTPVFLEDLDHALEEGLNICRVHGDFTIANIVMAGECPWIYDWEESRPDGPTLTDEVGFCLSLCMLRSEGQRNTFLKHFKQEYLCDVKPERRANAMASLAYQHMAGITKASYLLDRWNELRG